MSDSVDDLVSLLLQITAGPTQTDVQFTGPEVSDTETSKRLGLSAEYFGMLPNLLEQLNEGQGGVQEELIRQMVDYGNFLDIQCELDRQSEKQEALSAAWTYAANTVINASKNAIFQYYRCFIMNAPYDQQQSQQSQQQLIQRTKQQLKLPSNSNWDALSYKVPAAGATYYFMRYPQYLSQVSYNEFNVLMQYQAKLSEMLPIRLQEYRRKTSTNQDEIIDDYTILLERRLAGEMAESRTVQIKQMPVYQMLSYIISVVQCFRIGHIPGTIAPSKITACQDPVSAVELQQTILSIADKQIFQRGGTSTTAIEQLSMARDGQKVNQQNPGGAQRWGPQQARAVGNQARLFNEDVKSKLLLRNNEADPRKSLQNQLAGGANDFQQELEMARDGQPIYLRELDKEILVQSLTMLIACLRMRFNAVSSTQFEVTPQEDIDHLTMVEQLVQYVDPNAMEFLSEMVHILKASIANSGANTMYKGIGISPQDEQQIVQECLKELEPMARVVQIFDTDITSTGSMYAEFSSYCLLSLADYNRVRKERESRYDKRVAMFDSVVDPVVDDIDGPEEEQIETNNINVEQSMPNAEATSSLPMDLAQAPGQMV